jgi:excinuclease ABC subunit A
MPANAIIVRGAREHNLKNIDVVIPRDRLVVITGVSGSGKSSLAFDTIYAEGQRRYLESLSAYARQFLGRMEKPDVDYIEGLSPAISIDQKGPPHNPRSIVGTMTEIYDYLRLLFARAGTPHCPQCGRVIARQTVQQIVDRILEIPAGKRLLILAPVVKDRKGEYLAVLEELRKAGFVRVRVDGKVRDLSEGIPLEKTKKHTIEVVVDRLVAGAEESKARISDSVETALKRGEGVVLVSVADGEEMLFSEHFACVYCNTSLGEIQPRTFSFNSPHGACPNCTGLGFKLEIDPELVIPNPSLSISEGAIQPWTRAGGTSAFWYTSQLEAVAERHGFSLSTPIRNLSKENLKAVLYGDSTPVDVRWRDRKGHHRHWLTTFEGVINNLERRHKETESEMVRLDIERYMAAIPCQTCGGKRLKPEALAVTVAGKSIMEVTGAPVVNGLAWVDSLDGHNGKPSLLSSRELAIGQRIIKEVRTRLGFLKDIGLGYLTLDRPSATLSGGEVQRIRLATQIGSGLTGVLYVCDEPTVGLHPADGSRLIDTMKRLVDAGNSLLVVEHDEAMMLAADHIIDMGPGAGEHGGHVVASGDIKKLMASEESLTGAYLSGRKQIPRPLMRRTGNGKALVIQNARENNLQGVDVTIPLGKLVCVTGVSGSGKSTLINDILFKKMAQTLYRAKDRPGRCDAILGMEHIDKVINIDQSPIGRTPRSNPATYTGVFTPIRDLFAATPEARARGYKAGRFSFNVKGGRCEACQGDGYVEIEMQFLPDVTVPCEICKGQRYNREALEIHFKGKSIADVLNMSVAEAVDIFDHFPAIKNRLATLRDVGLGYIRLGQPATQLSGGEAQRIKLASELSKRATGRTLYVLDEPTTGLSFDDIARLLQVLQKLADAGNSVVIIEHHLDVIKNADFVIDLGPGAGEEGGRVVATGSPEEITRVPASLTGQYLKPTLARKPFTPLSGA